MKNRILRIIITKSIRITFGILWTSRNLSEVFHDDAFRYSMGMPIAQEGTKKATRVYNITRENKMIREVSGSLRKGHLLSRSPRPRQNRSSMSIAPGHWRSRAKNLNSFVPFFPPRLRYLFSFLFDSPTRTSTNYLAILRERQSFTDFFYKRSYSIFTLPDA